MRSGRVVIRRTANAEVATRDTYQETGEPARLTAQLAGRYGTHKIEDSVR
jgi:hypothetical protein